jgi:hypothetical protein
MKDARIVALPPEDPAVVPAASAHSDPGSPPFGVPAAAKHRATRVTMPKGAVCRVEQLRLGWR